MAEATLVTVNIDYDIGARVTATGAAGSVGPVEVARGVTSVGDCSVCMAIETADSQCIILNDSLDVGITCIDVGTAGGVMTLSATTAMQRIDAFRISPIIDEGWIGACGAASSVAVVTWLAIREVSAAHQHSVGGGGVLAVTWEVGAVTGDTLGRGALAGSTID